MNDLTKFKKTFDLVLSKYLDLKINAFSENVNDAFILDIIKYSQKLIESGGKRIRPYVSYLMYTVLGGKEIEKALELFVSLELFHSFALIHDDIMDKGVVRHGVKTAHEYIKERLQGEQRSGDVSHIAISQAILLGDLLLAFAFSVFDESGLAENNLKTARIFFSKMANDVILGQMIDVDIASRKIIPKELVDKKDQLKTASYTFIRPLQIGASLIKIDKNIERFCQELGLNLGLAFQLQDDLFDSENSQTKKETIDEIDEHFIQAKKIIDESNLSNESKENFYKFISILKNRVN